MPSLYAEFYAPYFGVLEDNSSSEWISVRCPFHDDHHASAGIQKVTGVFHCFACEAGSLSPAKFLHRITGMDLSEAHRYVDQFRIERGVIEKQGTFATHPAPSPHLTSLAKEAQAMISEDLPIVQEYLESRRLRFQTLLDLQVGYLPETRTHWGRPSLVFPYFHNRKVVGLRYRDIGGNKGGEPGCYFTLWGLDSLDQATDVVILAEGETDRLAIHQACQGKYTVVSTPTAAVRKEWAREFDGVRQVILIPQADAAAEKMINDARAFIPNLTVLDLPWHRKQFGNDACDWLQYHSDEEFVAMIDTVARNSLRTFVTGAEFALQANKPMPWLITNLLARNQALVIAGQPKAKKTWMLLNIIRTVLGGGPLLNSSLFTYQEETPARVLLAEEEGCPEELFSRIQSVCLGTPWEENLMVGHRLGIQLDSPAWIERISRCVQEHQADLLCLDPLHRMHSVDEDSASEMGRVWNGVSYLLRRFPRLSVIVLHHFNKSGDLSSGWLSFRGSSRTAAEADTGLFMEATAPNEPSGARIRIEGRSLRTPTGPDGSEIFRLYMLEDGRLITSVHDQSTPRTPTGSSFLEEMRQRQAWSVRSILKHYSIDMSTLRNWVQAIPGLRIENDDLGRPRTVYLVTEEEE